MSQKIKINYKMEVLNSIRGFYHPTFFSIYIGGEFEIDLTKISKPDLGTFAHEYLHYLQNITTIHGIRNSLYYLHEISEIKNYIQTQSEIKVPLQDIPFSKGIIDFKKRSTILKGSDKLTSLRYNKIEVHLESVDNEEMVCIDLYFDDQKVEHIIFGDKCVKESMAHLFQEMFDEDVDHPTFPYKSVEVLCEKFNPEVLSDKKKLMTFCLIALCSQNAGLTLFELLSNHEDNGLTGIELYKKYLRNIKIVYGNRELEVKDFFIESLELFKVTLSGTLIAELKHFDVLIEKIKQSAKEDILPIIELLYNDEISNIDKLIALVGFYNIPYIRSQSNTLDFPKDPESDRPAIEFVELLGQQAVLFRLLGYETTIGGNMCHLFSLCQLSEDDIIDENCENEQWKRDKACPFKIISDAWKLNEKIR